MCDASMQYSPIKKNTQPLRLLNTTKSLQQQLSQFELKEKIQHEQKETTTVVCNKTNV